MEEAEKNRLLGMRPALKGCMDFLRYVQGFSEFEKYLRRHGNWVKFLEDSQKAIDGQEVDFRCLQGVMNKWGYSEKFGLIHPNSNEYPEGWQFKDQYTHNPEMPPAISFVWNNLYNVPDEYVHDPKAKYDNMTDLFMVHPFDAPDWGCWGSLLYWARHKGAFYKMMLEHSMYAPEAISIFKPHPTDSHKLLSSQEKKKKNVRKLADGSSVHEIAFHAGGEAPTTHEDLKKIIESSKSIRENVTRSKIRRRTSVLQRDTKDCRTEGEAPAGDGGESGQE